MSQFKFGEFEIELDVTDYDFSVKYENLAQELDKKAKELPKDGKMSDTIIASCTIIFEFFEALFGKGTAKKMFGSRTNIRLCDQSLVEISKAIQTDKKAYEDETLNNVSLITGTNRQGRRVKK